MKKMTLLIFLLILMSGCLPRVVVQEGSGREPVTQMEPPQLTATIFPSLTPEALDPTPLAPTLESTDKPPRIYHNEEMGFAFAYPEDWVVAYQEGQSRGTYIQFTHSDYEPDPESSGLAPEEILMQVTVLNWDPEQDLDAFLDVRRQAWDSSGAEVISEATWSWGDGIPAVTVIVKGIDGAQSLFVFTYVRDRYVVFSGTDHFSLVESTARTLRLP